MEATETKNFNKSIYLAPLLAGAVAGAAVDVSLYPMDTVKTRLQSAQGFQKAGGFRGVYKGLSAVAATTMPTTALFFVSYELIKNLAQPLVPGAYTPLVHMLAAGVGEVLACVIRVPAEIAKQRKQTYVGTKERSNISILTDAYKAEGFRNGVYRGYLTTVARDLPFSFIELPVWELAKSFVARHQGGEVTSLQSACCGCLAGGFAGAVTTPLDLAKTRIMLAERRDHTKLSIRPILAGIYFQSGFKGLFAGLLPRTSTFMFGGFIFFGAYDDAKAFLERHFDGS